MRLQLLVFVSMASIPSATLRYCAARMAPWGFDDSGCSNAAELQTILSRDVMIRR